MIEFFLSFLYAINEEGYLLLLLYLFIGGLVLAAVLWIFFLTFTFFCCSPWFLELAIAPVDQNINLIPSVCLVFLNFIVEIKFLIVKQAHPIEEYILTKLYFYSRFIQALIMENVGSGVMLILFGILNICEPYITTFKSVNLRVRCSPSQTRFMSSNRRTAFKPYMLGPFIAITRLLRLVIRFKIRSRDVRVDSLIFTFDSLVPVLQCFFEGPNVPFILFLYHLSVSIE